MTPLLGIELHEVKKGYASSKRLFDLLFSALLLIISLPLSVLIACAIRVNSRGPIIFSQQRIGQNRRCANTKPYGCPERRTGRDLKGQPITIYKFRTMRVDAAPYCVKPQSMKDKRLTATGKFLRATSLDELPQFFNVLRGDLSIVGPRPEMPFIVQQYGPFEAQRLLIRPGITGLWQIYGTRKQHIHENIHYDLAYIRNQSFWLDCVILLRTALFILRTQNL